MARMILLQIPMYHYLLMHFPIALFIVGYMLNTLNFFNENDFYKRVGDLNMFLGVIFGVLTIISGFVTDNILVGHMESPFPMWSTHGTHMIVSVILFFGLLLLFQNSLLCPPFQFFVVNPNTSTLTEHLSKVLERISAHKAAIVIGLPLIEPELSINKVTTVSLKSRSFSFLKDKE